jgi:hypothetical protein
VRPLLLAAVLLASCGAEPSTPAETASPPPAQVLGVITEVGLEGDQVVSFEVEARDGSYEILIEPTRDYGFNLRHLLKHRDTGDPVAVDLEARGGELYAVSILDA